MEFESVNNFSTRRRIAAAILAGTLLVAACGDDDDDDAGGDTTSGGAETTAGGSETTAGGTETTTGGAETTAGGTGTTGGGEVSGDIVISGSSTVEPISNAVGAAFADLNAGVGVTVTGPGTGDGFAQFCAGELDIADASRPINEEEIASCEEAGIEFVELKVALDGLSVITSAENTAVECLSFPDLYALLGPDATGRNNWADATEQADEIGGTVTDLGTPNTPFPDADLAITAPGEESGTYDAFVELALLPIGEALGVEEDAIFARPDYTASPNDNVIVEGIAQNPTSLGWVGFAFVEENLDTIRPIPVDGGGGCVEPTPETIASGEYPIARDLFIYVSTTAAEENPAVGPFVDYYLSDEGLGTVLGTDIDAGQVPYVPLAPEDLEATRTAWADMTTGTQQG